MKFKKILDDFLIKCVEHGIEPVTKIELEKDAYLEFFCELTYNQHILPKYFEYISPVGLIRVEKKR